MGSSSRTSVIAFVADFDRSAELYEKCQVPFSDLISRRLVLLGRISVGERVLDIGTGTGSAAIAAARTVGSTGSVTGIDLSTGMLAIARRKASTENLRNLRFVQMDALRLDFADESFDVVISNLGIPGYAYEEIVSRALRILRKGGRMCFAEVTSSSLPWSSFSRLLLKYRVQRAPPAVLARRKARGLLQEVAEKNPLSNYASVLKRAGFKNVQTLSKSLVLVQPPSNSLFRYYLARELLEYAAMPQQSRERFQSEALRFLEAGRKRGRGLTRRLVKFWLAEKPDE